jgi:aminopeptidase N
MQINKTPDRRLWLVGIVVALLCLGLTAVIVWSALILRPAAVSGPVPLVVTTPAPLTVTAEATATTTATASATPVSGGQSIGDPYAPELGNTGYDVRHYTLQLALDPAVRYAAGVTTIEAVATLDQIGRLSLDFAGFTIESITVDGVTAVYNREGDKLLVDLPQPLPVDTLFSLVITYAGEPEQRPSPYLGMVENLGLIYPGQDSLFVLAEPDGARFWFPANDHPRDKATFRFELTAPAGYTAVANGRLTGIREGESMADGRAAATFVWEHNYPMATYLAVAAVGHYERADGNRVGGVAWRDYVFPELRRDFDRATAVAGEAMAWMVEQFGPYPFDVYGHVTVYAPGVSMETQTMVMLSHQMLTEGTVIHELAHIWFGNWVSLDSWADMWRNEGFATYVTILWETRHDPEALELQMVALEQMVLERQSPYPLEQLPPELLFSFDSYLKGAVVVHRLRQEMGDEAFFAGLRHYFERYGGGTASHAQFQAVLEEAAGFSLDPFFNHWLRTSMPGASPSALFLLHSPHE